MQVRPLVEALGVSAAVTAIVTVVSMFAPPKYVATAVGFVFLGATWLFVWRKDDREVEAAGLALGGVVLPGELDVRRAARSAAVAFGWALAFAAVAFVPFYFGWRAFWRPHGTFALKIAPLDALNEIVGQFVIIALPEEAFYRGYLQTRLDQALPGPRVRFLGASLGPAILVTSLVFALGHLATIHEPARLAVFFPSLAFGFLRQRTGGIGAGLAFHALCNLFSETLGKGFHLY